MNRKAGIIIALVLTVILVLAINLSANQRYAQVTKTVKILKANRFISAGERLDPGDFTEVDVPEMIANDFRVDSVAGKTVRVPLLANQYLMSDNLDTVRDSGFTEVYVSVDVASSACAIPGNFVDIYTKSESDVPSELLYKKAKVLSTVDANGEEIEKSKSVAAMVNNAVSAIGLEVPDDLTQAIVSAASQKKIYLVKSAL